MFDNSIIFSFQLKTYVATFLSLKKSFKLLYVFYIASFVPYILWDDEFYLLDNSILGCTKVKLLVSAGLDSFINETL